MAFQYLDYERTWWRLSQKRVVRTELDIYVFLPVCENKQKFKLIIYEYIDTVEFLSNKSLNKWN